jgi:hypothetical protein
VDVGGLTLTGEFKFAGIVTEYHPSSHVFGGTRFYSVINKMGCQFASRWGNIGKK